MATRTQTLRQIIKVEGVRQANRDVNSLKTNIDSSSESLVNMATKFISVGLAMKVMTDSYNAFIVQRDAIKGIDIAIKNMGASSTLSSQSLQKMASDLQAVSNYGDELTLDTAFRPLILAGLQSQKVINDLVITMADVAAGTVKSFDTVANQITRLVADGNASVMQLSRATGIAQKQLQDALRGASNQTQRAIILAQILGKKFGGSAKQMIDPMTQLNNTIGDLKQELGKAFYPAIKVLAQMATSFLSNQKNIESIITNVKILTASLLSLGVIKFGGMLISQFNNVGIAVSELNKLLDERKVVRAYRVMDSNSHSLAEVMSTVIAKQGGVVISHKKLQQQIMNTTMKHAGLDLKYKQIAVSGAALNKNILTSVKAFASATLGVLGWIGVAYTLITTVYQIGKSFGWWGGKIKLTSQSLTLTSQKINTLIDDLRTLSTLKYFNKQNIKDIADLRAQLQKYGITLDRQRLMNEGDVYLNQVYDILQVKAAEQQLRASYENRNKLQEEYNKLLDKANKLSHNGTVEYYSKSWFKLQKQIEDVGYALNDANIQYKTLAQKSHKTKTQMAKPIKLDISALSTYYNTVKFEDQNYLEWQLEMNKIAADDFKKSLIEKGYSQEQANKFRIIQLKAVNDKLYQQNVAYHSKLNDKFLSNLQKRQQAYQSYHSRMITIDQDYYNKVIKSNSQHFKSLGLHSQTYKELRLQMIYAQIDAIQDLTDAQRQSLKLKQKIMMQIEDDKANKTSLQSYYNQIGNMDKNYYATKKQMIREQIQSMNISQQQKDLLLQKRMGDLEKQSQSYQNFASIATSAIESISSTLMNYVQITAKSSNVLAQIWHNLANAIIAQIGRIITKMTVLWVLQKALNLFSFGTGSAISSSGGGLILDAINGQIASIDNNYNLISNSPITTPNTTIRSNDNSIIDKLNEVVDAININGIKGKIHTINRIELARQIDIANMERSVL